MKCKTLIKRIALSLSAFLLLVAAFTLYANIKVEQAAKKRIYTEIDSIPYNKVALLLGTNPLNRRGRPNSYFTNRINTAAELYHAGKVDFIIASGDNHIKEYDEPTAMRDSLMAHGVPESRIILDFAGFRTLDSVVRAKEVFGCDSLTIISQEGHNARALYLAEANGIKAITITAPLRAGRWVRTRLALREWLACDKMMLDIWFGKQPHFLGEKIEIPEVMKQKSYSTADGMTMRIIEPKIVKAGIDSLIVEFSNTRKDEGMTGEWFRIDKKAPDGHWQELPYYRKEALCVVFNAIGWIVRHDTPFQMTVKPWFYKCDWTPGTYRVAKTFSYPPYPRTEPSDTAFVEFQIR
ncbi:ElyC/SanA/YdcF family protein [Bacteroides acidifaciens]|jgi:SanA protein|uniref:ElyC/SanA/YdcF family protein n=1 Tax=Bacteroides acidifaciens TaxID=85831 RepID=UPI00272AC0C6|nr:ElyC/SanA/YdcF family protein [Bacteroides acidifaciens]